MNLYSCFCSRHGLATASFLFVLDAPDSSSASIIHSPSAEQLNIYDADNRLFLSPTPLQWPIVYRPEYNLTCGGVERLHPFDSQKWGRIFEILKKEGLVDENTILSPNEASTDDLMTAHSPEYLASLKSKVVVARIFEIFFLVLLPHCVINRKVLRPMRYQVGGSVAAGRLALDRGWAINIGGGFHHAYRHRGGGFCAYADISMLVLTLLRQDARVKKVMIVDLDAHQGNGHERDLGREKSVFIMDVFNSSIYPRDKVARDFIRCCVQLRPFTEDAEYLEIIERNLEISLQKFQSDIIVYNAGTDILVGDRLGRLSISAKVTDYGHLSNAFQVHRQNRLH